MLILFQSLFTLFSLFALFSVFSRKRAGELGPIGFVFWLCFWLLADVAVWWPNGTAIVANTFGIGRGTDFIVYVSLALIFFILFRLHVKIESLSRDVTKVVRRDALSEHGEDLEK